MPLESSFSVKLGSKIIVGTVCVGRFDGEHIGIAAATAAGKILLYSSADSGLIAEQASGTGRISAGGAGSIPNVSILNVNQEIKALAAGRMRTDRNRDVLVVGTPAHLLAYDVYDNTDLFHKDVPDGVNCITIGELGGINERLAIIGGNCALQGFDAIGEDRFWTVTGDNVSAMCLCDFNDDREDELIVGSEDFDVRVFRQDEIISETTETDAVTNLLSLGGNQFAYALANGTLGAYQGLNRLWRIKSKNHVTALNLFDIDEDGQKELVGGWSNGKIDFRRIETGEVIIKEQMSNVIAGIVIANLERHDGPEQVVAVSIDGEIRGYRSLKEGGKIIADDPAQEIIRDLSHQRQNLLLELENYKNNRKIAESPHASRPGTGGEIDRDTMGVIPANTQLQTSMYINPGNKSEQPCVEMHVETSNDTLVRCVVVFAEGVFSGESHVIHPNIAHVGTSLKVQMRPGKDIGVDLHLKALVGYKNSLQYHVFELSRAMPKYAMYALCERNTPLPESYVTFTINERPQRLVLWTNENFLVGEELGLDESDAFDARFLSLRGAGVLGLQMDGTGKVSIWTNNMDLCGEVVHDLAAYFGLSDLSTVAEFPKESEHLIETLDKISEMYSVRERLTAQMADQSSLIKAMLVRAEEARMMRQIVRMKKHYTELYNLNQELITQYKVRCNNYQELLNSLKHVNQIIQKAGRLRVGQPKTAVINGCRTAIKDGNTTALPKIIRLGPA